jgi:hypothetical protein
VEDIMKSRWFALPLVALGAVVLAGACTVTTSTGPGGFVEVTCTDDNDPCDTDADCCSNICASDGNCGIPTDGCSLDNDPCETDDDCCSDICADDGYCGLP